MGPAAKSQSEIKRTLFERVFSAIAEKAKEPKIGSIYFLKEIKLLELAINRIEDDSLLPGTRLHGLLNQEIQVDTKSKPESFLPIWHIRTIRGKENGSNQGLTFKYRSHPAISMMFMALSIPVLNEVKGYLLAYLLFESNHGGMLQRYSISALVDVVSQMKDVIEIQPKEFESQLDDLASVVSSILYFGSIDSLADKQTGKTSISFEEFCAEKQERLRSAKGKRILSNFFSWLDHEVDEKGLYPSEIEALKADGRRLGFFTSGKPTFLKNYRPYGDKKRGGIDEEFVRWFRGKVFKPADNQQKTAGKKQKATKPAPTKGFKKK